MNRTLGLLLLLGATLAVGFVAKSPHEGAANAIPATYGEVQARAGGPSRSIDPNALVERLGKRGLEESRGLLMQGRVESHKAKRPAAVVKKEPAAVPQFPFRVGGHVRVAGEAPQVVLLDAGRAYVVRAGETLDRFRIDALGAESFSVTYLPSGEVLNLRYADLRPEGRETAPTELAAAQGSDDEDPPAEAPRARRSVQNAPTETSAGGPWRPGAAPAPAGGASPQTSVPAASLPRGGAPAASAPAQLGGQMHMVEPSAGGGMVMTPPRPGGGMVMTPGGGGMTVTPPRQ